MYIAMRSRGGREVGVLTISLSSEARVGSVFILRRAARRRALSRPVWSTSRNLSTSLGVGSMGTHKVANSTRDAILM